MVAATRSRIRRRSTTRRSTSPLAVTTPTPRRPLARRRPGTAPPPLRSRRARVPRCAAGRSTPDGPASRTTAAPAPGSRPARNLAGTPGVSTPSTAPVPARGSGPPRAPRLRPAAGPAPTGPGPPATGTGRPRGRHRRNNSSPRNDVSAVPGWEKGRYSPTAPVGGAWPSAPQGQQLALADADGRRGQPRILLDEDAERFDLLGMRQGVVGDEHAAGPQDAGRVRPPRRVLGALGVEEQQVDRSVGEVGESRTPVRDAEGHAVGETRRHETAPGVVLGRGVGVQGQDVAAGGRC